MMSHVSVDDLIAAHPGAKLLPFWDFHGLRDRVQLPEIMDDPRLTQTNHQQALAGLHRLNAIGFGPRAIRSAIRHHLSVQDWNRPLKILDVGCADGSFLEAFQKNCPPQWSYIGVDVSPFAIEAATQRQIPGAEFQALDALRVDLPEADVVFCSNFLHHLSDPEALILLEKMKRSANNLILVLDLERSWLNYWMIAFAARLFSRSRVVHVDSGLSIRASRIRSEIERLAIEAGMKRAIIQHYFPCRILLTCESLGD